MEAQTHTQPSRRLRVTLGILLGLLVIVLSAQYSAKATQRDGHRSAFLRWRPQLLELRQGENVYHKFLYPNPPVMGLILLPVVTVPEGIGLPPLAGALLWFYIKVGLTLLLFHWIFRLVEDPDRPFPYWAKVLTVLLTLRPVMGDLSHGNVNLFILFLITGALYALYRHKQVLCGLTLALAIACKVTPALFIPYLIWKRATKALVGCAVGIMLFFWPGFVPAAFLGWEKNQELVQSWYHQMVTPYVVNGEVTSEHNNQSLPGFLYRLFTHNPSFSVYHNGKDIPTDYHNVASLPPSTVRWLIKVIMLFFVALIAWTCRPTLRDGGSHSNPARAAEYGMVLLGMLIFSERTWKHHCVTFALPYAVLCYYLAVWWEHRWMRRYLITTLLGGILILSTTSTSLMGKDLGKMAQVYGAYTFGFFILLAALAVVVRFQRRLDARSRSGEPLPESEPLLRKAG